MRFESWMIPSFAIDIHVPTSGYRKTEEKVLAEAFHPVVVGVVLAAKVHLYLDQGLDHCLAPSLVSVLFRRVHIHVLHQVPGLVPGHLLLRQNVPAVGA